MKDHFISYIKNIQSLGVLWYPRRQPADVLGYQLGASDISPVGSNLVPTGEEGVQMISLEFEYFSFNEINRIFYKRNVSPPPASRNLDFDGIPVPCQADVLVHNSIPLLRLLKTVITWTVCYHYHWVYNPMCMYRQENLKFLSNTLQYTVFRISL